MVLCLATSVPSTILNYGFICHLISVHTKAQTQTSDMYRSLSGAAKMHLVRILISEIIHQPSKSINFTLLVLSKKIQG